METVTALILLPVEYNPNNEGRRGKIPIKDFQNTAIEITKLFNLGCTMDIYPKHGYWARSKEVIDKDVNVILEINSLPRVEKKRLIKYCKRKLLDRFKQEAILIKFIPQVQTELVTVKK